jgi:dihydroflavonol-4-reductase
VILVTGATGHLGNVLVRKLLDRGERVRALVLPGEALHSLNGLMVEVIVGNILDRELLDRAVQGVDTVYHLAGIISILPGSDEIMQEVNVTGARNVAEASLKAGVRRLVHVSSIHAFRREPHGTTIDESTPLAPDSDAGAYDRTKAEGALAVLDLVDRGLDAVIACPTGIIGPYDYQESEMGGAVTNFAAKKLHFLVKGAFDFVDVRDVAKGLILAAEKGRAGETYILSGTCVTLEQIWQMAQAAAGSRSPRVILPFKLALFFSHLLQHFYRLFKIMPRFTSYSLQTVADNSSFSCAKASEELAYSARPLKDSIADFLSWRSEYYQKYFLSKRRTTGRVKRTQASQKPG